MTVLFNAKRLHDERKLLRLTQTTLAEKANTSERYVRSLEAMQKTNPSAIVVFHLSKALHLAMEDLMIARQEEGEMFSLSERSQPGSAETYRVPMPVTAVLHYAACPNMFTYPLCPRCKQPLEHEYQPFCAHCGQALAWEHFSNAAVILAHSKGAP